MHDTFGLVAEPAAAKADPRGAVAPAGVALDHRHANSYLARPGDRMKHIFLLIDGWAARYRLLSDGRRQITALFLPGDLCDLAWRDGGKAVQHVIAITAIRALRIELGTFERQIECDPGARTIVDHEAHLLAEAQCEWLVSLGRRSAVERLAHLFCELVERIGAVNAGGVGRCEMPLTQIDMADITGLTPVHVNRTLQQMRRSGLIELKSRQLKLRDFARIKKIAFFRSSADNPPLKNNLPEALKVFQTISGLAAVQTQGRLAHA